MQSNSSPSGQSVSSDGDAFHPNDMGHSDPKETLRTFTDAEVPARAWRIFSPAMRWFVFQRVMMMIPTAILASIGIFVLIRLVPGGPAIGILGIHASPQSIAELNRELGLNHPLVYQYWHWLLGALHGDFGNSLQTEQAVTHMVAQSFPVSAELVGLAVLFTLIVGFPLGILVAWRAGSRLDRVLSTASGVGLAVPDFFLAIILIAVFGIFAHLLPELGFVPFVQNPVENLVHMVLPSVTMGMGASVIVVRQVRAAMVDSLNAPYIRTARAMGLAERTIVWRYSLRNALPTIINVYGLLIAGMFGATLIIEEVFVLPGMGNSLVNGIGVRDYTLIQGITMVYIGLVLVVNFLVDVLVAMVSPRLAAQK
jgi:peptide/nickel transport system permease protein